MEKGAINAAEKALAKFCIRTALSNGASAIRVSLIKDIQNGIDIRDGAVDSISYSCDRSMMLYIFANSRFGTFTTNRLDEKSLEEMIIKAIDAVSALAEDPCRSLPKREQKAAGCTDGNEMELYDSAWSELSQEEKLDLALKASVIPPLPSGIRAVSTECSYSDELEDRYIIDSDGFEGRRIETSFGFCCSCSVDDGKGNKYSGYCWDESSLAREFKPLEVCAKAFEDAVSKINPGKISAGKYNIVVDRRCGSKLLSPILDAMDGYSLQQQQSFLSLDDLGKKIFPEILTVEDRSSDKGRKGSRLFDNSGLKVEAGPFIEKGVVKKFFITSYIANKTGREATYANPTSPAIGPFICNCIKNEVNLGAILEEVHDGLYITDFNGGNCNGTTGDFSFGVEGFLIKDGKLSHPVREALMTGNIMELWNSITAAGSDDRKCAAWRVPTLAFRNVKINV